MKTYEVLVGRSHYTPAGEPLCPVHAWQRVLTGRDVVKHEDCSEHGGCVDCDTEPKGLPF